MSNLWKSTADRDGAPVWLNPIDRVRCWYISNVGWVKPLEGTDPSTGQYEVLVAISRVSASSGTNDPPAWIIGGLKTGTIHTSDVTIDRTVSPDEVFSEDFYYGDPETFNPTIAVTGSGSVNLLSGTDPVLQLNAVHDPVQRKVTVFGVIDPDFNGTSNVVISANDGAATRTITIQYRDPLSI